MNVVIVGAGYAGTIAANRLKKKSPNVAITVVNPRSEFIERVRLHEEIAGTGAAATPLAAMLSDGIALRTGSVRKVGDGVVTLDDGETLSYEYLFLAVGSTVTPIPGATPVGTWEGAVRARECLAALPAAGIVTVIGGGLTGIETASELAAARPDLRVRLVAETVGASLSAGARRRVHQVLEQLNVTIVNGSVAAVEPGGVVRLESGTEFASDLTLWAVVSGIPDLAASSGLTVNDEGRAVVDQYLRSVDDQQIFVIGDCAAVPGARLCCATASPQGAHAADTLARILADKKPKPYSMGYTGQALSLGRKNGLVQASSRDGQVRWLYISGRIAAVSKEYISRYAKFGSRTATYAWLPGKRTRTQRS
ncbi:NAD(P)/FAD-dependent oxidoreductase [Nocardia niigatensis]